MGMLSHNPRNLINAQKNKTCVSCKSKINIISCVPFALSTIVYSSTALVDDRLAGEGTGKSLGINDPILAWVIIGVFTSVWGLYTAATKELGGQQEEDGLGL